MIFHRSSSLEGHSIEFLNFSWSNTNFRSNFPVFDKIWCPDASCMVYLPIFTYMTGWFFVRANVVKYVMVRIWDGFFRPLRWCCTCFIWALRLTKTRTASWGQKNSYEFILWLYNGWWWLIPGMLCNCYIWMDGWWLINV